jgi:serine/threonine protein kinase
MDQRSAKRLQVHLKDWNFIKTIGLGLFGKVKLAQHKKDKTFRAIKIMQKRQIVEMEQVDHIYSEVNLLKHLDHPFIVNFINS